MSFLGILNHLKPSMKSPDLMIDAIGCECLHPASLVKKECLKIIFCLRNTPANVRLDAIR